MGCWNETCGFSQQSINYGDKIYAFIIINNSSPYKSVYANGISLPMAFPIEAEYNDYGSIENPKINYATESTIALFNKYYTDGHLIVNYGSAYPKKKETVDSKPFYEKIEEIFFDIERGYITLRLKNYKSEEIEHSLSFMLIKKNVLENAWSVIEDSNDYDIELDTFKNIASDVSLMIDEYINNASYEEADTLEAQIKNITEQYGDKSAIWSDTDKDMVSYLLKKLMKTNKYAFGSWGGDTLESKVYKYGNKCCLLRSLESVHKQSFDRLFEITKSYYSPEKKDDIIDVITKFLITIPTFYIFRKIWCPQGHCSQHDSLDIQISYIEKLLLSLYEERNKKLIDCDYDDATINKVKQSITDFKEKITYDK